MSTNEQIQQPTTAPAAEAPTEELRDKTQPAPGEQGDPKNITLTVDETEEEKKLNEAPTEPVFERTDNPGLNVALEYIEKFGFKPENEAVQKAFDGDFEDLEK